MHFLSKGTKRQIGDQKEQQALDHLVNQGLTLIEQNYQCRLGEVDLILNDPNSQQLVFCEVRYRKNADYGGAAASVTKSKQDKIKKTALFYISQRKIQLSVRFDVVAIEGEQLNWIPNAFV